MADEVGGVAFAGVAGESAYRADLAVAGDRDSFACHGYELSICVNAEVVAEDAGSDAEETGEGGVSEGDHGGGIVCSKGGNGGNAVVLRQIRHRSGLGEVHLPSGNVAAAFEARDVGEICHQ